MIIHKICSKCLELEFCSRYGFLNERTGCIDYYVDDFNGEISYSQPKFTLQINTNGEINDYHFLTFATLHYFLLEELRKENKGTYSTGGGINA